MKKNKITTVEKRETVFNTTFDETSSAPTVQSNVSTH
jgi:hypothetical protein